jgi:hypothetical protein
MVVGVVRETMGPFEFDEIGHWSEVELDIIKGLRKALFKAALLKVAGFAYVPEPVPMRITTQAILYYLLLRIAERDRKENRFRHF